MVIKLGEMLVSKGLITSEQLKAALAKQRTSGEFLGEALVEMGFLKEEILLRVLSEQLNIPYLSLKDTTIDPLAIKKMPAKFAWHYKILPIKFVIGTNTLTVASHDPLRSLGDVKVFLGCEVTPVLAGKNEIMQMIRKYYGIGAETVEGIIAAGPQQAAAVAAPQREVEDIEKLAGDASIIKLLNQIIIEANRKRATDIHIEPFRGKMSIRYRIDGVLYNANASPEMARFFQAIVSRIKIMSKLNIVERRLPQDGRIVIKIGKEEFDLRVSILPTPEGESVVIRILPTKMIFSLEKLGLEAKDLEILEQLIAKPHGIIFVTGPTGSGKSTTLYASLNKIKSSKNKIITLEDPIEYELEGISQVQVSPEIGLTFAQGLRSMLRHDPDIMMVGEVRDFETAELAIRVALTGHLVFSTLHTNDAAGAVTRLLDIGVEPYLVTSSVEAFIAQRLVRLICPACKVEAEDAVDNQALKQQIIQEMGVSDFKIYRGKGCEECNFTGFKERIAIYEILVVDKAIKELILKKASADQIREKAIEQGMRTLRLSGWQKVIEGLTTPDEVIRATQIEE